MGYFKTGSREGILNKPTKRSMDLPLSQSPKTINATQKIWSRCANLFNPFCTIGFFLLVWNNLLWMVHCIYQGVTGYFQIKCISFSEDHFCLSKQCNYEAFHLGFPCLPKYAFWKYKSYSWMLLLLLCLCLTSHQQLRSYGHGPRLKVSSDRLVKQGIEPVTPGLQGKRFIHYTTAAPITAEWIEYLYLHGFLYLHFLYKLNLLVCRYLFHLAEAQLCLQSLFGWHPACL